MSTWVPPTVHVAPMLLTMPGRATREITACFREDSFERLARLRLQGFSYAAPSNLRDFAANDGMRRAAPVPSLRPQPPQPKAQPQPQPERWTLRRVRLNNGGYEPGRYGRYYGTGMPLYRAESDDGDVFECRASTREGAKRQAVERHPLARFYR